MTRRSALAGLGAILAAKLGQTTTSQSVVASFTPWPKGRVTFDLDSYTAYEFTLGDRVVTVTPKELMEALKPATPEST